MGESTLGGLLKSAAEEVGLEKRVTNHSMRKTTVTSLSRAGVPPQKIKKITGHKTIESVTGYDAELTDQEHEDICGILQGNNMQNAKKPAFIMQTKPQSECPLKNVPKGPQSTFPNPHRASTSPKAPNESAEIPPFMSGSAFYNCTFQFGGKF